MLKANANSSKGRQSPLVQWVCKSIGITGVKVQLRLRGNDLHILCEGDPCPDVSIAVSRLVRALQKTNLDSLIPADRPQIYQIFLYGRRVRDKQATWTERIYLNQLDRYLELLVGKESPPGKPIEIGQSKSASSQTERLSDAQPVDKTTPAKSLQPVHESEDRTAPTELHHLRKSQPAIDRPQSESPDATQTDLDSLKQQPFRRPSLPIDRSLEDCLLTAPLKAKRKPRLPKSEQPQTMQPLNEPVQESSFQAAELQPAQAEEADGFQPVQNEGEQAREQLQRSLLEIPEATSEVIPLSEVALQPSEAEVVQEQERLQTELDAIAPGSFPEKQLSEADSLAAELQSEASEPLYEVDSLADVNSLEAELQSGQTETEQARELLSTEQSPIADELAVSAEADTADSLEAAEQYQELLSTEQSLISDEWAGTSDTGTADSPEVDTVDLLAAHSIDSLEQVQLLAAMNRSAPDALDPPLAEPATAEPATAEPATAELIETLIDEGEALTAVDRLDRTAREQGVPQSPASIQQAQAPQPDAPQPEESPAEEQQQSPRYQGATSSAMIISNRSLAQQGHPDAIARYLSETLSTLGVGVNVVARAIACDTTSISDAMETESKSPTSTAIDIGAGIAEEIDSGDPANLESNRRLWIFCQSAYSPDPLLVAEPVAEQLRELKLSGFQDAVILNQVSGEATTDWSLRVDLTPPDEMLQDWARWGDIEAISRLLNQALAETGMEISVTLKEKTLHCFCTCTAVLKTTTDDDLPVPDQEAALAIVAPLFETLAPQGIEGATIFGQRSGQKMPVWVEWLDLPASEHPALAESTLELAQTGDRPAIAFLLSRLLNPDLDLRLATGGVRIQLRRKHDLLHIMADAPLCPKQNQVGPQVAKFLRQLRLPRIAGVRIYGRRAGQKRPLWNYGVDFISRNRLIPEATPEFAASEAYVGDLIAQAGGKLALRPDDLTVDEPRATFMQVVVGVLQTCQSLLLRSQLFIPSDQSLSPTHHPAIKVALIWGTAGVLLTLQADWALGQILSRLDAISPQSAASAPASDSTISEIASDPNLVPPPQAIGIPESDVLPNLSLNKSQDGDNSPFNDSGFTHVGRNSITFSKNSPTSASKTAIADSSSTAALTATPPRPPAATNVALARSPYATFNSRLLDEKFALYRHRIAESGPPDVLIVGSSRALRGIDPVALRKALAKQGYNGLDVFNFGLNGATAQVVDLLIRQFLAPNELPKLILWADGARAFNSGRLDITYNGVLASKGYKQLDQEIAKRRAEGTTSTATTAVSSSQSSEPSVARSIETDPYQAMNSWLNQGLSSLSAAYPHRDQLKTMLQHYWAATFPQSESLSRPAANEDSAQNVAAPGGKPVDSSGIDFDGFLSLSAQFNPATYYQNHARVAGAYDADYQAFRIEGKQTAALNSLIQFAQANQISLVFINLPLTQDYLDPTRAEREDEFQHFMLETAIQHKFLFRNFGQLWPTQHSYFSDPSHLNRYGAYAVTNQIAQDPMISWPQPD